jgi:hypothetical protein
MVIHRLPKPTMEDLMTIRPEITGRRSFRIPEIARRNGFSNAFVYKEIAIGRLRARKAGRATIVTAEDEMAWLNAMPVMHSEIAPASA